MQILLELLSNGILIIEGYCRWLYDIITGRTKALSKERLDICNQCEYNKNGICDICGCILKAKVRVKFDLDENGKSIDGCPEKKW